MEVCVLSVFFVFVVVPAAFHIFEQYQAAQAKAADERFLKEHPDAWKAKQLVSLEKDRLDAQKKYADEESRRQNAGALASIVRIFW